LTNSYKYTGVLGKRPRLKLWMLEGALCSDDPVAMKRIMDEAMAEWTDLIAALLEDCGQPFDLSGDTWKEVALKLAKRHIPAFQDPELPPAGFFKLGAPDTLEIGRRQGRPRTGIEDDLDVYAQMQTRLAKGQTERQAARQLANSRKRSESPDAICSRYRRTAKRIESGRSILRQLTERMKQN
jgi:hypothetical protein